MNQINTETITHGQHENETTIATDITTDAPVKKPRKPRAKMSKEERDAKRHAYYAKNRERIRIRDNNSRKKRVEQDREKYRELSRAANKRHIEKLRSSSFPPEEVIQENKDRDSILRIIRRERRYHQGV